MQYFPSISSITALPSACTIAKILQFNFTQNPNIGTYALFPLRYSTNRSDFSLVHCRKCHLEPNKLFYVLRGCSPGRYLPVPGWGRKIPTLRKKVELKRLHPCGAVVSYIIGAEPVWNAPLCLGKKLLHPMKWRRFPTFFFRPKQLHLWKWYQNSPRMELNYVPLMAPLFFSVYPQCLHNILYYYSLAHDICWSCIRIVKFCIISGSIW